MKIFHLPDLGEGLAEGEIREWYVKVGDLVKVDQPLVAMETAKALVDVPSPYTGKIIKLHGNVNDIIKTGAPLISIETDDEVSKDMGSVVGSLEESSHDWKEDTVIIGSAKAKTTNLKAMPAARVLAKQLNIDLNLVTPTGKQGFITPDDVKEFTNKKFDENNDETLHGVRRFMAQAMVQSHQVIVPVTVIDDADITHLPPKSDITVKLFKAIIAAVRDEPALNAWFDGEKLARKLLTEVNIGLAVDTDEGLFVPVIKQAESKSDESLREMVDHYKNAVKTRTFQPSELQGATITLSNFGMIAGRYATPIIVPPTVAILACGRSRDIPLVKDKQIIVGRILPLSLTFDHRAVTGAEATRFLGAIIKYLQSN